MIVTAVLALAGAAAARAGLEPAGAAAAAVGLGAAWAVQAGAYWTLAGRLAGGRRALGVWVGGVAARMAGLAVLVVAAGSAGWPMATVVVAYGAGVVTGLMLEVLWLWKAPGRAPARTTETGMIGTTGTGEALTSRQEAGQQAGHAAGEAGHGAGQEAGHAVQEAAGHGAEEAAHGAQEAAHGAEHAEWGPDAMLHHVTDAQTLDLGFVTFHLPEFEALHTPALDLGLFTLPSLALDLSISKHVVFLFLAGLLTILTMWLAAREAQKLNQGEEAPGGLLNAMEAFYLYLRDEVALKNVGHGGERYVPFVIALFFFILYANLLGLVPFGSTATGNIMVTGALAFVSFVVIEAAGYRALGPKGYLGTIFFVPKGIHPVGQAVLLPIFLVVEVVGKLTKPFALAMRLFANMTAGHFVILALLGLILTYGGIGPAGVTTIFGSLALGLFVMFLEIFVAFLQAYIFAILTAVFIGLIRQH